MKITDHLLIALNLAGAPHGLRHWLSRLPDVETAWTTCSRADHMTWGLGFLCALEEEGNVLHNGVIKLLCDLAKASKLSEEERSCVALIEAWVSSHDTNSFSIRRTDKETDHRESLLWFLVKFAEDSQKYDCAREVASILAERQRDVVNHPRPEGRGFGATDLPERSPPPRGVGFLLQRPSIEGTSTGSDTAGSTVDVRDLAGLGCRPTRCEHADGVSSAADCQGRFTPVENDGAPTPLFIMVEAADGYHAGVEARDRINTEMCDRIRAAFPRCPGIDHAAPTGDKVDDLRVARHRLSEAIAALRQVAPFLNKHKAPGGGEEVAPTGAAGAGAGAGAYPFTKGTGAGAPTTEGVAASVQGLIDQLFRLDGDVRDLYAPPAEDKIPPFFGRAW